jgi:WD40 repeat protein
VVTASRDKTARLWDADGGGEITVLRGHEGWLAAASLSPHGRRVVTASEDKTARIWFVGRDDADLIAHACAVLPRDLTPEQMARNGIDPDAPWPCRDRARTLWPHDPNVEKAE